MKRLEGWRNVILALAFLVWAFAVLLVLKPKDGYTDAMISAFSGLFFCVGSVIVAVILGRSLNKYTDNLPVKWQAGPPAPPTGPSP